MKNPWWDGFPWRMVQTNLPEVAMRDIEAERYVLDLKEMHATVALINAAGIIASYPTELPFHYQSPHLTGDTLKKIIEVCHREGIKVIARTDFSKVRRPVYEAHPEWAARFAGGVIEDYNGNVHCCVNSDYPREYAFKIVEELLTTHDFDGIFFNLGGYLTHNYSYEHLGICQCDNCKERFRAYGGEELPTTDDGGSPQFQLYRAFKRDTVLENRARMAEFIGRIRPEVAVDKNYYSGRGILRNESNTEIGRPLPRWQYSASSNTKRAVTSWPGLVSSNATVDFLGYYYRHVAVNPAEQELRLWQNLANCGGLDYYLIGRLDNHHDRSGFDAVRRVFAFHEEHFEDTFRGLRPDSDILLVASGGNDEEYRGWFRLLAENHFLFDVVDANRLDILELDSYKAVILPDARYISDNSTSAVDSFVRDGGTLIATGESGFYSDDYTAKGDCGLESLGIEGLKQRREDMLSAMLRIDDPSLFPSLAGRDLLYFGASFLFCEYQQQSRGYTRLIPPHTYGPPELCYWETELELPGINVHPFGAGHGIHLPWLPGTIYHRDGYDNTLLFVRDFLGELCGVAPVGGSLSPMVEVTRSKSESGGFTLIQLVNGSGHFGNSFFDPSPIPAATVSLPWRGEFSEVVRISDGQPCRANSENGILTIDAGELGLYEGLKIR